VARTRNRGFTLLEVLAVLVIIGITLTFAVLSIGDGGQSARIEREARRLAAVVDMASEEAVMQSRELGLRFSRDGYRFVRLDSDKWQPVGDDDALKAHDVADGIHMAFSVEGVSGSGDRSKDAGPDRPQVLLLSSGERTPFDATFSMDDGGPHFRVSVPPLGEIGVEGTDTAP